MSEWVFGKRSRRCLDTADRRLVILAERAIEISPMDFAVICGHRTEEEQERAYAMGFSKLRWPHSPHNREPATAIDCVPWVANTVPWDSHDHFYILAGVILSAAQELGLAVRWGGDWKGEWLRGGFRSTRFLDLPHYELVVTSEQEA